MGNHYCGWVDMVGGVLTLEDSWNVWVVLVAGLHYLGILMLICFLYRRLFILVISILYFSVLLFIPFVILPFCYQVGFIIIAKSKNRL